MLKTCVYIVFKSYLYFDNIKKENTNFANDVEQNSVTYK